MSLPGVLSEFARFVKHITRNQCIILLFAFNSGFEASYAGDTGMWVVQKSKFVRWP